MSQFHSLLRFRIILCCMDFITFIPTSVRPQICPEAVHKARPPIPFIHFLVGKDHFARSVRIQVLPNASTVFSIVRPPYLSVMPFFNINEDTTAQLISTNPWLWVFPGSLKCHLVRNIFAFSSSYIVIDVPFIISAILVEITTRAGSLSIDKLSLEVLTVGEEDLSVTVWFIIDPLPFVNKALLLLLHRHKILSLVMSLRIDFERI